MKTLLTLSLVAVAVISAPTAHAGTSQKLSCSFKSEYRPGDSNEIRPYLVKREAPLEALNDIGKFAELNEMLGNHWIKASASITGTQHYVQIIRRDEQNQQISTGSFSDHIFFFFEALGGQHTVVCQIVTK